MCGHSPICCAPPPLKSFSLKDLTGCAETLVGDEVLGIKGISGGQKRRVSLAIDLVKDPQVSNLVKDPKVRMIYLCSFAENQPVSLRSLPVGHDSTQPSFVHLWPSPLSGDIC